MKKLLSIVTVMAMILSLSGCGDSAPAKPSSTASANSVQNVLDQQMKAADEVPEEDAPEEDPSSAPEELPWSQEQENTEDPDFAGGTDPCDYDVDLTSLSSTMVYSEVYDMLTVPENYLGKKIRMGGRFALYQTRDAEGNLIPDLIYYACIIADATACCSQGLEFILAGDLEYPDDYPELGSEIVVSGIFETYDEFGTQYCHLVDAVWEK